MFNILKNIHFILFLCSGFHTLLLLIRMCGFHICVRITSWLGVLDLETFGFLEYLNVRDFYILICVSHRREFISYCSFHILVDALGHMNFSNLKSLRILFTNIAFCWSLTSWQIALSNHFFDWLQTSVKWTPYLLSLFRLASLPSSVCSCFWSM